MSASHAKEELYIATIRWDTHFQQVFFEGPATPEAAAAFKTSTQTVQHLAERAESWETLLARARVLFVKAGFVEVQP